MEAHAEYLKVREVADGLRVSPLTIYRAIREGRLEAVRLGGNGPLRVPASALETYALPVRGAKAHAVLEA